jgi:hypothetical protein
MTVSDINVELNHLKNETSGQKRGFKTNLRNYFTEYSSNTGFHGMKYLGEQNRTIIEK